MAQIRLNPLSSNETHLEHDKDETLQRIFDRFFETLPVQDDKLKDYYTILLDGKEIDRELWETITPQDQHVLIAVTLKGGDNRGVLRSGIMLAIIVGATLLAGPGGAFGTAGLTGWQAAAFIGAVSIGGGLLANALIPPVNVGGMGGLGSLDYEETSSQTYRIGSQSNTTSKYGPVMRPYGRIRVFPRIAATPYTEVAVDPLTGLVIQDFYCIYDFGYGPHILQELKIGETPLNNYNEVNYRLVDLNRPASDEGDWDTDLQSNFEYYKGDNEVQAISATINSNSEDPGAIEDDYQITRSVPDSGDSSVQQVSLTIVAPQGLTTLGTDGNSSTRSVDLFIEYAAVGSGNWRAFNDTTYTDSFEVVGEISPTDGDKTFVISLDAHYTSLSSWGITRGEAAANGAPIGSGSGGGGADYQYYRQQWGLRQYEDHIRSSTIAPINSFITMGGEIIGKIKSRTTPSPNVYEYILYSGITKSVIMTDIIVTDNRDPFSPTITKTVLSENRQPVNVEYNTAGSVTLTANKSSTTYFNVRFKPKTTEQIEIRLTRNRSYGGYEFRISDSLTWSSMTTRFDRVPIITANRHLFLELKIRATDQLNGAIQNLSGVVESVLNTYDGTSWNLAVTKNPAWVYTDILTGSINKNALALSRLDTASLLEWEAYCDAVPASPTSTYESSRFECNFIIDYSATLNSVITKVAGAAQAGLNLYNGKYGVLIDKRVTTPVQVFTPRNSWGFGSRRTYVDLPHALKIRYVDGRSNWGVREEIVYATGYDANTATIFEEMETFACTNNEQAWRYGRYMLAQAKLRQENISISVDFENLVCTRGDYVLYQQDVMKAGGVPARVKSISGNDVTIDDSFIDGGDSYGYTFRGISGVETGTLVIVDSNTATLTGVLPAVGDLFVWGELGLITIECIVKAIVPGVDLTASLALVERADAIHDAESDEDIPEYDPALSTAPEDFSPPPEVETLAIDENTWSCFGGDYQYLLDITWDAPLNSAVDVYETYVNAGTGYVLAGYSSDTTFKYIVDDTFLGIEHSVKVLAVAANGNKLSLGEVSSVSATPVKKTIAPSDVGALYLNVTNETTQLEWSIVPDCDVAKYLIRYSPSLTATWYSSIPLQEVGSTTSSTSIQSRTGSYFIKAIDWNDNESANAAGAITSIPDLVNLNVIDETNDFPTLPGSKTKTVDFGSTLILQEKVSGGAGVVEYWDEGYYLFENLLDLGEIYTVRLQSLIEAEGYSSDDLMSNWPTLTSVTFMSTAGVSDWNVESYYRSTDEFITIDTWTTLSSIAAMDSGSPDIWSDWRKFTIGDFTGRIFQFRLRLISNKASITPRVVSGTIRSDMPDRVERFDNITVPDTGYNLLYSPAFKGPGTTPNVQITQDNAQQGDYYVITSKTLTGFTINFYDKTDTLVSRQMDVSVLGFGRLTTSVL